MSRWPSFEERLRQKISRRGPNECWPWLGARNHDGYPLIERDGKSMIATRAVVEEATGQAIPAGLFALHRCDNPPCCNPSHLFVGTNADNMADMAAKGRSRRKETHCKRGHEFSVSTTYWTPRGLRGCRPCRTAAVARSRTKENA